MILIFILIYGYIILFIRSLYIIYSLFILYTIVCLIIIKIYRTPIYSIVLYTFIQELRRTLFIYRLSYKIQIILLLLKGGFSPFHGWISYIAKFTKGKAYLWLLRWQKLPIYILMVIIIKWQLIGFILISSILPLIQSIFLSQIKIVLFIVLTSRGNNLLIFGYYSPNYILVMLLFYISSIYYLPGLVTSNGNFFIGGEVYLLLFGFPGSLPFYIKLNIISFMTPDGSLIIAIFILGSLLNLVLILNFIPYYYFYLPPINKQFIYLAVVYIFLLFI